MRWIRSYFSVRKNGREWNFNLPLIGICFTEWSPAGVTEGQFNWNVGVWPRWGVKEGDLLYVWNWTWRAGE